MWQQHKVHVKLQDGGKNVLAVTLAGSLMPDGQYFVFQKRLISRDFPTRQST